MRQTKLVQFRLTQSQYDIVQNRQEAMGFTTVAAFIRACILGDDLATLTLLRNVKETLDELKNNIPDKEERKVAVEIT